MLKEIKLQLFLVVFFFNSDIKFNDDPFWTLFLQQALFRFFVAEIFSWINN